MQTKISEKISFRNIFFIIVISSVCGLVFNYFNPDGLKLLTSSATGSDDPSNTQGGSNAEPEFYQPIEITSEDAHLLFNKGVRFIDARTSGEYKKGHIPSSMNIAPERVKEIESILRNQTKQTPFVIYSNPDSPELNKNISEELFGKGYKRIYIFPGGFDEWMKNNFAVWK